MQNLRISLKLNLRRYSTQSRERERMLTQSCYQGTSFTDRVRIYTQLFHLCYVILQILHTKSSLASFQSTGCIQKNVCSKKTMGSQVWVPWGLSCNFITASDFNFKNCVHFCSIYYYLQIHYLFFPWDTYFSCVEMIFNNQPQNTSIQSSECIIEKSTS